MRWGDIGIETPRDQSRFVFDNDALKRDEIELTELIFVADPEFSLILLEKVQELQTPLFRQKMECLETELRPLPEIF